ncbi:MAG TPA: glycoside hydrolase family 97 catalytic domain-containing protein [Dyella sp.]|uniref:glycoside hydrolase family 97 protein n=1 Tax=Dyella sp. TaxID=1869338 RepID=UPI002F958F8E
MSVPNPRTTLRSLLCAIAFAAASHATASNAPTPQATLQVDPATGTPKLSIQDKQGQHLLDVTLGLRTTEGDFVQDLHMLSRTQRTIDERYRMTTGKRLDRHYRQHETRYLLATRDGRQLAVVVRVASDGIAFRYEVPGSAHPIMTGEASAFALPADAPAWLLPYNPWYEKPREQTTSTQAADGDYGYPSLFRIGETYVLITEANADGRYDGSHLQHKSGSSTYDLRLADPRVETDGTTPWRTLFIGNLATVTGSTLVDDLADPARFTDTSWIRPGKVAWSWLSDRDSPGDPDRQKAFIDFASRHGWPYVLIDEGWKAEWLPAVAAYARQHRVDLLLWFKWQDLDTQAKRDEKLAQVKAWGVKGIKVDFMNSDSQARYRWYDAILADTARLHLMIDLHGSTIPHGLARTWPHIMSMEGVRGTENDPPVAGNTIQPYTRNVVGSMDFTPVAFDDGPKQASIAHETALPIVFESAWTSFADSPQAYEKRPQALALLDRIPTVWDDTRWLAGTPGQDIAIARRSGNLWFIGAIAAGPAHRFTVPLAALGGQRWLVDILQDGPGENRTDVVHSTRELAAGDSLSLDVRENGGFAAVACPARPGLTSCYQPSR